MTPPRLKEFATKLIPQHIQEPFLMDDMEKLLEAIQDDCQGLTTAVFSSETLCIQCEAYLGKPCISLLVNTYDGYHEANATFMAAQFPHYYRANGNAAVTTAPVRPLSEEEKDRYADPQEEQKDTPKGLNAQIAAFLLNRGYWRAGGEMCLGSGIAGILAKAKGVLCIAPIGYDALSFFAKKIGFLSACDCTILHDKPTETYTLLIKGYLWIGNSRIEVLAKETDYVGDQGDDRRE